MICIALIWKSISSKEIATVKDGSAGVGGVVVVSWALNAENCFGACIDG